ncbi:MAG TPA: Uma2 family endonuclease [Tepidisphaeraceae bacterium]|jgi:Uma2 family endonuclease
MVATSQPDIRLAPAGTHVLFNGISWETYERLSMEIEQAGRRCRITYDSGNMEVEMPTRLHEIIIALVCEMLEHYCIGKDIAYMPTGATTWRRRLLEKGIEADASYYVQNVHIAEAAADEDLDRCPPPDVAFETEITKPLLPKLPVYAGIGIAEIWHMRGDLTAQILRLNDSGSYEPVPNSIAIPAFTAGVLAHWLDVRSTLTHFETLKRFRNEFVNLDHPR